MTAEPAFSHRSADTSDAEPVPLGPIVTPPPDAARPVSRADRGAPSAADVTSERMLRARSAPPTDGWRRLVFALTGGLVSPGPGRRERERRELVARIKAPVVGCRRIAVVSRKGGVGKTTTTLMLGHTFASLRGDRVVALDGNPDAGSLAHRVRRETTNTIVSLLADGERIERYADIRAYTNQAPTRLEVVAADDDPRITDALRERDFQTAAALLEVHYNLVCLDTGTGVLQPAARGILRLADQIVLVTEPALDSVRAASSTLDWLAENSHAELVDGAVAVINSVSRRDQLEVAQVTEHFAARCRAVVQVPWDPHLQAGAEAVPDRLRPATRDAYLRLAAGVADGFAAHSPPTPGGR